jgi:hypothetical protein
MFPRMLAGGIAHLGGRWIDVVKVTDVTASACRASTIPG